MLLFLEDYFCNSSSLLLICGFDLTIPLLVDTEIVSQFAVISLLNFSDIENYVQVREVHTIHKSTKEVPWH